MKSLCQVALLGVSLTLVTATRAQDYDSTQQRLVTGTVLVEPGTQPPGRAAVILYTSLNIYVAETSTTSSGGFSFAGVSPGNYRVVVRLAGYQEASADVSVYRGVTRTQVMPIVLRSLTGSAKEPPTGTLDASEWKLRKEARQDFQKAREALEKRKATEARDRLKGTIRLAPDFAPAHYLLGIAETLLGEYANAAAEFKQTIQLDPHRADPYFGLGKAMNLLDRPREALPIIAKGLELAPNSPLGLFEKSRAEFSLGDYSTAEHTARESLKQASPPPSEVHLILANCYLRLRRYAQAATELDLYLKLEPKSPSAAKAKETLEKLEAAGISPVRDVPATKQP